MSFSLYPIAQVGDGSLFASSMPKPQRLSHCLDQIEAANISTVVCLLEQSEMQSLGLAQWLPDCSHRGIKPVHFPIKDFGTPAADTLDPLVSELHDQLSSGNNILVHCRGGIGRSGLLCCAMEREWQLVITRNVL
ncbi:MAG: dual specificity protein phosphatase family protein [Pseudomonadota bacterium]